MLRHGMSKEAGKIKQRETIVSKSENKDCLILKNEKSSAIESLL